MNQHMFLEATEMHTDVLQGDSVENIDQLFTNEDEFICLGKRHRNCWQEKKACVRSYSIPSFGGKRLFYRKEYILLYICSPPPPSRT